MPLGELSISLAVMLLVRVGQILLISGSVRSKNAAGASVRLLLDLSTAALALWTIGAAFVPTAGDHYITWGNFLGIGERSGLAMMVLPLILIATGAMHGATAERTRLGPVLAVAALIAITLPILHQIETRIGFLDKGVGASVLVGGAAALASAIVVGPRKGKFNRDQSVNFVPGHNLVLQLVGIIFLLAGFLTMAQTAIAGLMSMAVSTLTAAAFGRVKFGKIDTGLTLAGAIGGLCAGSVGVQPSWLGVLSGVIAGLIVPWLVMQIETRWRIDDVTASGSSYLAGGIIGVIAGATAQFIAQPTGWVVAWFGLIPAAIFLGAILGGGVFFLFKQFDQLHITETAEFDGMDLSELDVNAYPDFQQTMIKSYHLREL